MNGKEKISLFCKGSLADANDAIREIRGPCSEIAQ